MSTDTSTQLIQNIEQAKVHDLAGMIDYKAGKLASLTLAQQKGAGMTLFAIDKGEGLSPHSAPGDAFAQVLEGAMEMTIDGQAHTLRAGQVIVMPANITHAVRAVERCKFLLFLVKSE